MRHMVLALAIPLLGCGNGPSSTASEVQDSAGVRIVMNSRPTGSPPSLDPEPAVVFGAGQASAPEFYSPISAVRLSDGRVVAAGWAMTEIHFYGPTGEWQRTVGRRGAGPGEFEALGFVYRLAGDTLLTFEPGSQRLQRWTPAGDVLSLELLVSPPGLPGATMRGPLSNGALLLSTATPDPERSTELTLRNRITLHRADPGAATWATVLSYGGAPSIRNPDNPQFAWGQPLFAPGSSVAHLDERIAYTHGDRFEVQVHDVDGKLREIIRRDAPAREISSPELTAAIARWGEGMSAERWARMEPLVRETATYRTRPAVRVVRFVSDGRLWVEFGSPELGEVVQASLFDLDGRWQGDVALPEGLVILHVHADGVLGYRRDEDGFYQLAWYRLTTP